MRKEKSRDAARSRRSKENHEFYELAKLLPLPAAITSQLDFLDKASIIRLTISFLKLRQFSVNGHPPWAPDFTTLGSVNPYSAQSALAGGSEGGASSSAAAANDDDDNCPELAADRKLSANQLTVSPSASDSASTGNSLTPSNVAFHAPQPQPQLTAASESPFQAGHNQHNQLQHQHLNHNHQHQHHHGHYHGSLASSDQFEGASTKSFVKTNASLFDVHQGTHILQSLDGFAFAIGRDGRFLYISETVSMYLGLSQVEMTGSSVFDYTHQQDHAELARQLGIPLDAIPLGGPGGGCSGDAAAARHRDSSSPRAPGSVASQYSAASSETLIEEHMSQGAGRKRMKTSTGKPGRPSAAAKLARKAAAGVAAAAASSVTIKDEPASDNQTEALTETASTTTTTATTTKITAQGKANANSGKNKHSNSNNNNNNNKSVEPNSACVTDEPANSCKGGELDANQPATRTIEGDPLVRQFCIRMKSTLTKRGCQHFKSSGYRVVHVVAHLRSYQSNDHGHLMDPLDDPQQPPAAGAEGDSRQAAPGASSAPTKASSGGKSKKGRASKASRKHASAGAGAVADNDPQAPGGPTGSGAKLKIIGMVAVAIALPPPSINELRLESDTFVLRLGLDLKITHVEPKITELLDYPMELLAGRSLYSFVHPADLDQARTCHRELLQKGQMMSGYYRLLARTGGFIWIQTCATLICNSTMSAAAALLNTPALGSLASPSPQLPPNQQQHLQLQMSDRDSLVMSGRGPPANQTVAAAGYFSPGTPNTTAALSAGYEAQFMEGQLAQTPLQQQPAPPPPPPAQQQHHHNQQQEQCVIFVNYMITDVIETGEILDVCQSKDFMPIISNFSGFGQQATMALGNNSSNNNNNNHNHHNHHHNSNHNHQNHHNSHNHNHSLNQSHSQNHHGQDNELGEYVSPTSTCSSPCVAGGARAKVAGGGPAYSAPSIINLSSPSHRVPQSSTPSKTSSKQWRADQQAATGRHASGASKANRRQAAKVSRAAAAAAAAAATAAAASGVSNGGMPDEQQVALLAYSASGFQHASSESHAAGGHGGGGGGNSPAAGAVASYAAAAAAAAVAAASGAVYDPVRAFPTAAPSYASQAATDGSGGAGGVNLALSKHLDASAAVLPATGSWLASQHQHQQQQLQPQQQQQQQQLNTAHQQQHAHHQHHHHQQAHHYASGETRSAASGSHQQVAAGEHYLGMDRSSIYKAASFAAAGLAASGTYAGYHPAVGSGYHAQRHHQHQFEQHEQQQQQHQNHLDQQQQHPQSVHAQYQHAGHHHQHSQHTGHSQQQQQHAHMMSSLTPWDSVAATGADHHGLASISAHHHVASASAAAAAAVYSHQHHPPWF